MSQASKQHRVVKILQINLRHSRLATAALSQVLLELDIDIALIQEPYATKLNSETPPVMPFLPDSFEALHNLDSDHHYGAAIVAKKTLKCRLLPELSVNHVAAAQLDFDGRSFLFLSVYLRPSLPSLEAELLPILSRASSLLTRATIGADMNAKSPLWNSNCCNARGRELESLLTRFPLNVCNVPAASLAFAPIETSFIDVTLVGNAVIIDNWHFPDIPSLSDHPFIAYDLSCSAPQSARSNRAFNFLPPLQNIDKEKFQTTLRAIFVKRKLSLIATEGSPSPSSIDDAVQLIVDIITQSVRSSRIPVSPHSTIGRMPWWNDELSRLRRETRKARKRLLSCATSEKALLHKFFKQAKARYQRALRLAIEKAWLEFCARASDSDLLESLKRLAGIQSPSSFPSQISVNGNTLTDPALILEQFASHFFCPPTAPASLGLVPDTQLAPLAPLDFPPISAVELSDALTALSPEASPGPDGISAGLLSLSAQIIHPFLLSTLNSALKCSYFPAQWRHARVKIIPKLNKDNYALPNSYRPISIVSTLSKVFEKILLSRLSWLAKSYDWFNDRQHGFREAKSTESAAHQLVSFIEDGFAKGYSTAAAFIDIQSAFDKANHQAILAALRKKGCPMYLVRIIASFLRQRKATLCSESIAVTVDLYTGCPQGSVLSAFLWLVLVDDVLHLSFDFHFLNLAYADDVTLAASHRDVAVAAGHLQVICDKVANWAKSVDLSINAAKTTFILFSRKRSQPPAIVLQIGDQFILPKSEVHYLGFLLDHRLSWHAHIQAKCNVAKKLIFLVKRCLSSTWGLSASRLKKLYSSSIEPTMLYGCSIWCPVIERVRSIRALRSTQRLMALVILRAFKSTSAEACFALCGFLPIDLRIAELAACRLLSIKSPVSPSAVRTIKNKFPNIELSQQISIPTRHYSPLLPPWLLPALPPLVILPADGFIPLLPSKSGTVRVYTDGSVISGCVGYGLVVVNSSGIVSTCRGKLPDFCSIFQAEGQAILQAIRYVSTIVPKPEFVEIFSDSRAALVSSLSSERVSSPFHDVRTLLLSRLNQIQLFWIAGHRGHHGNEIADLLAKQGALGPGSFTDVLPPPYSSFRLKVRQTVQQIWSTQWTETSKASVTRAFFPTIDSTKKITNLELPRQVVQLFSGHCRLRSFLFKIACAPSPICLCGIDEETVEHHIFFCSQFNPERVRFKEICLSLCKMWPPPLADIARRKPLLAAFITFISKSHRLDL